jgi:hypothetical protein
MNTYCTKTFIAKPDCPSTSTVVCYDGPSAWIDKDKPESRDKFLEVSSCHCTIRLHQTDIETDKDFIDKLKLLGLEIHNFIRHLESK